MAVLQKHKVSIILIDLASNSFDALEDRNSLWMFTKGSLLEGVDAGFLIELIKISDIGGGSAVLEKPLNKLKLLNLALDRINEGAFFGFLNIGEAWDWAAVRKMIVAMEQSSSLVGIGSKGTLIASGVTASGTPVSPCSFESSAAHRNPISYLFHPIGGLAGQVYRKLSTREVWRFNEQLPNAASESDFLLRASLASMATIRPDLGVAQGLILVAGGEVERKIEELRRDEFFYRSEPAKIFDQALLSSPVTVSLENLQSLFLSNSQTTIYAPFERLLRKGLGLILKGAPSIFYFLRSRLVTSEARIIQLAKWLRDFVLALPGLFISLRALTVLLLHRVGALDLKKIPIYIINRNRLEMFIELIEFLEKSGFSNINIIDNASTYPPLLEYYSRTQHNVIRLASNVGPLALWSDKAGITQPRGFYILSDSDVVPAFPPTIQFVEDMIRGFVSYPYVRKIGLSLRIDNIPDFYAHKSAVIAHESRFWVEPKGAKFFDAPVDTTFAVYAPNARGGFWVRAFRTNLPWIAEHRPWYINSSSLTENEQYYSAHAAHWASWSHKAPAT